MDPERSRLSQMMELYDNGTLSAKDFDRMMHLTRDMASALNMSMEEAYGELSKVQKSMSTFVDDQKEPTESEVQMHLDEMDDLETTLAQLEAE